MLKKTGIYIAGMLDNMFMTFRAARLLLCQKKADMSTNKLIIIALAIILLFVMFFLYKAWTPNPDRIGGCFTDAARIGPFA